MGPFDRPVRNSFERMFDFNGDGKLDLGEEAMMYDAMEEEEKDISGEYDNDGDGDWDF